MFAWFGKLVCKVKGHRRGKLIHKTALDNNDWMGHYICPRCGCNKHTRKIRKAAK